MKNTKTEYTSDQRTPVVLLEMEQLLPPLSAEQFSLLERDILENGCYTPIIVNKDMVLVDGHNRFRICLRAETEPGIFLRIKNTKRAENTSKYSRGKDGILQLEINKHEDLGLVDIWLTQEDQTDPAMQAKARELSRRFAAEKWTVVVFYSGQQDLAEETSALLRYNRRRSAERAVQREKARKRQASR